VTSRHVALLGDSIFDNAAYTQGEPDVVAHLRACLPSGWRASLLAVDGSITGDLARQIRRVTADVTDLVVSIGGNDALAHGDLLGRRVSSTAQTLRMFAEQAAEFRSSYARALDGVMALDRPTRVCTIYEGDFDVEYAVVVRAGLVFFNDIILREAFERRLDVIDLRLVCTDSSDYANPIEPSGSGGRKIAESITAALVDGRAPGGSRVTGWSRP
jgi:hypothetical protein